MTWIAEIGREQSEHAAMTSNGDMKPGGYQQPTESTSALFPLQAETYAAQPAPSIKDFQKLWVIWDIVTRQMIPEKELLSKPINLRNCCLFYLGHIPNFLDIHLVRATGLKPTPPAKYREIFERGIDPDVENPEHCHAHSDIPDEWPALGDILDYQQRVRERTRMLYTSGEFGLNRKVGRALWIGFEHEVMHLETLLYMLLQSDNILPPPGPRPNFEKLALQATKSAAANEWITVPKTIISVGMTDPENDEGPDRYFGWDNEKPERSLQVDEFEVKARPITNREYAQYLQKTNGKEYPASWTISAVQLSLPKQRMDTKREQRANPSYAGDEVLAPAFLAGKYVRTVYGPVPLALALDWPIFASYNELASYADWIGGRIPTQEEVRSIYEYVNNAKTRDPGSILTKKISAVNGHLSNNGIEISPPSPPSSHPLSPHELFTSLEGCNVGFQNWHPVPISGDGNTLCGRGEMGGVWEWTSSVLERHEGFQPMELYPAYTDDFFDGKHNIVLGGSWATHPRIAGRKSFVNWYQRSYPYAWCGARLARKVRSAGTA